MAAHSSLSSTDSLPPATTPDLQEISISDESLGGAQTKPGSTRDVFGGSESLTVASVSEHDDEDGRFRAGLKMLRRLEYHEHPSPDNRAIEPEASGTAESHRRHGRQAQQRQQIAALGRAEDRPSPDPGRNLRTRESTETMRPHSRSGMSLTGGGKVGGAEEQEGVVSPSSQSMRKSVVLMPLADFCSSLFFHLASDHSRSNTHDVSYHAVRHVITITILIGFRGRIKGCKRVRAQQGSRPKQSIVTPVFRWRDDLDLERLPRPQSTTSSAQRTFPCHLSGGVSHAVAVQSHRSQRCHTEHSRSPQHLGGDFCDRLQCDPSRDGSYDPFTGSAVLVVIIVENGSISN